MSSGTTTESQTLKEALNSDKIDIWFATHQICVNFEVCLELVFIWSGVVTMLCGTFQQNIAVLLNDVTLKAVLGDGRIIALGAVIQMFSSVCTDMHVIVHLVPKQLA